MAKKGKKNASQKQNPSKKTSKKKGEEKKSPSVVAVERTASVPGLGGGDPVAMKVTLYQVSAHVIDGLVEKGAEVEDEDRDKLYPTRKDATGWIKEQRAAVRGTPGLGKLERQGKALYRAAKMTSKVLDNEKLELTDAQRETLNTAVSIQEQVAEELGFNAAAYETQLAQKAMEREAAKQKEAANS